MSWGLQVSIKVEDSGSIQPFLLACMAGTLSLCRTLAWQGQRSPRELDLTVVYAPAVQEVPATGDDIDMQPSASTLSCSYSCVQHLPSSLGRIWGKVPPWKRWVPSLGSGTATAKPGAALGGLWSLNVPAGWSQPSDGALATVLQARALSSG